jgi:hypothetical protein
MPPKSTRHRQVGTLDPARDKLKLSRSACRWTKTDLAKLGVDYQYDRFDEIVIGNRGDVPTEFLQGYHPYINDTDLFAVVESYAKRIESIDMQVITESRGNNAIIEMLCSRDLPDFKSTYVSLATLLKRLRPVARQLAFNTPPGQTTVPQNPTYSSGSTGTNSSVESKPEIYAQNVALKFIEATCFTVSKWLEGIQWINPVARAYLSP